MYASLSVKLTRLPDINDLLTGNFYSSESLHFTLTRVCVTQLEKRVGMFQAVRKMFFPEARCVSDGASKSFEALFEALDVNKDGKVDIAELRAGLATMGFSLGADAAQVHKKTPSSV